MVEAALKYQLTFVVGSFAKTPPLENYDMKQAAEFKLESGSERFRKLLLFNGESGSACGKLFARSLIPYLSFPEGQLFEDMGVIASICSRVGEVAFSDAPFYAYVTRPGSITTFKNFFGECLASIACHDYSEFEVIIFDEGSINGISEGYVQLAEQVQ